MTHAAPQLHRPALPAPDEVVFAKALCVNGRSYDVVIQSPGVQIAALPHMGLIANLFQATVESYKGMQLKDIDATALTSIQLSKQYGYCSIIEPDPAQPGRIIDTPAMTIQITPQWRQRLHPQLASSNTAWSRLAHKTADVAIETILELENDAIVSISSHNRSSKLDSNGTSSTPSSTEDGKSGWLAQKAFEGAKAAAGFGAKHLVKRPITGIYDFVKSSLPGSSSLPKPRNIGANRFGFRGDTYESMYGSRVNDETLNGKREAIAEWIQNPQISPLRGYQAFWDEMKREIKTEAILLAEKYKLENHITGDSPEATRKGEDQAIVNFAYFLNGGQHMGVRISQDNLMKLHRDKILN